VNLRNHRKLLLPSLSPFSRLKRGIPQQLCNENVTRWPDLFSGRIFINSGAQCARTRERKFVRVASLRSCRCALRAFSRRYSAALSDPIKTRAFIAACINVGSTSSSPRRSVSFCKLSIKVAFRWSLGLTLINNNASLDNIELLSAVVCQSIP